MSPASIPLITGFGFGSFPKPSLAATMTKTKGPVPSTRRISPDTKGQFLGVELGFNLGEWKEKMI